MYRECNLEFYLRVAFSRTHKKNQIRFHDQLLFYTGCRELPVPEGNKFFGRQLEARMGIVNGAQRWALQQMDGLAERTGRLRGRPVHLLVGERGEREAVFYLQGQGTRWWRGGGGRDGCGGMWT